MCKCIIGALMVGAVAFIILIVIAAYEGRKRKW